MDPAHVSDSPTRQTSFSYRPCPCRLCGRLDSLFGSRRGVCPVCVCKGRRKITAMLASKLLPERCQNLIVQHVVDYCCRGPDQVIGRAAKECWRRLLLGQGSQPLVWTGYLNETRIADSDDESCDGAFSASLQFVNPMWKLAVSRGPHWTLGIIIDMLPPPPWK